MMRTLATGWWCRTCEAFETEDDVDTATEVCRACGCTGSAHVPADIVTKGWGV